MAILSEKSAQPQPRRTGELRRSYRVMLRVPIVVMGAMPDGTPFSEETITSVVNAHGALITLRTKVLPGQKLSVANLASGDELVCRVVSNGAVNQGKTDVAIEFATPAPFFWKIAFPPADWVVRPTP